MHIGIDASRAFLKRRTGIEEYAYQTIKHLRDVISHSDTVTLYVRRKITWEQGRIVFVLPEIDFSLPSNFRVKGIWAPRFWTQIRLSLEMLIFAPDVLFIPAHTIPFIHPKKTIVTIHGLEYEFCPQSYSFFDQWYMRLSIRFSCMVAKKIICVSENTKQDVVQLYHILEEKISVIYEGFTKKEVSSLKHSSDISTPYILFIGRLEERKNIKRIIEAFEILKAREKIAHTLILAGKPGYSYESIALQIKQSTFRNNIKEMGYITEEEKWQILSFADIFLFPSLYEGFGIPLLEAQSVGVPLITSSVSSLPEVAGKGALYVDPLKSDDIARGIITLLQDKTLRDDIIEEEKKNVHKFSWEKCAQQIYNEMEII